MVLEKVDWYRSLNRYEHIMIFGAKFNAQYTYKYVRKAKADIDCFVVSERKDNPFCLDGKPVKTFGEISEDIKGRGLVIISQKYEDTDVLEKVLFQAGFQNIISSATQITNALTDDLKKYCNSVLGEMRDVKEISDVRQRNREGGASICIYAVTSHANSHKAGISYHSKYVKYIHAGAALAESKVCEITDDNGDNISEWNPYFCELSAGYWIYKNDAVNDYVGLYHYSRGLDVTDGQIEGMVEKGIDALLPFPYVARHEMITRFMLEDAQVLFEAIHRASPEYRDSAERYFSNKLFFPGNIVLARKPVFDQYYGWMFRIFTECKKIREENGMLIAPRIWGYYGEHLTNVFFTHHIGQYAVLYAGIRSML